MTIMNTITKEQIKFLKVVTDESTESLAKKAGMGVATLQRFEAGRTELKPSKLMILRKVADEAANSVGWRFTPNGGIDRIPSTDNSDKT